MVMSDYAREDVDSYLLTKECFYYVYDDTINDLAYETQKGGRPTKYKIPVQVTIQRMDSKYVIDGILKEGDLVGLFRYKYFYDSCGLKIHPALVPKKGDMIRFLSKYFIIKECTPATGEDDKIIAWDFKAGQTDNKNDFQ